ncbi:MAG: 1-deoxy-D-xylulose-5-phosphate reductoisomerase [Planctomycetota bacterium]|nr:1-deoxy-D-xylulose-5-phosphate reductoisomerase [Planctomycetota bacterium]MDA1179445.1 1-deoxy-D-xylulose-5-phosphate reductoisomerase [Planctomycetota bacterium]
MSAASSLSDKSRSNKSLGLAILGASGSIGKSTLDVVRAFPDRFHVVALSAHQRLEDVEALAHEFRPAFLVATCPDSATARAWNLPEQVELLVGPDEVQRVVCDQRVDIVVAAIVGRAGLEGTWAAVDAGKRVALANKETLVMAGQSVMQRAAETGALLLPIDSEHSAIFQAMGAGGDLDQVRNIILTASGGPFLRLTPAQLEDVTVSAALRHPTWNMGPKITIDSATMMNKALEVIEARWLFGITADRIQVVVHPQSLVHSMVEFVDGAVLAQLSPPDMRLPIQFALTYPERSAGPASRMDWTSPWSLQFEPPDLDRFPSLKLGFQVARDGGTAGAVLNAANEAAVERFLAGELRFLDISRACSDVLAHHTYEKTPTLTSILSLDRWAREEMKLWKRCS